MSPSRIPDDLRYFIIRNNQKQHKNEQRKRRLFNRFYRKSLFYISSLVVRAAYILIFAIVLFTYNTSHGFRNEIFEECTSSYVRTNKSVTDITYIQTNFAEYRISKSFRACNSLHVGDVILVEHNIYGKPIFFTKEGWDMKYGIYTNYIYYYMLLFATLITFFFNDGLDFFSHKLLYLFYVLNLLSIIYFFIS